MNYIVVLLSIMCSSTPLGWIIPYFWLLFLAFTCINMVYKKHIRTNRTYSKRNLLTLCAIMICLMLNLFFTASVNGVISNIPTYAMIIAVYCIAETMSLKEYLDKYIDVMCVLAVFSILFWLLAQFDVFIAPFYRQTSNGYNYYMNLLYIYRNLSASVDMYGINVRNQGIFWEPGAYQGYLIIALLPLMCKYDLKEKKNKVRIGILAITILTTQSTSGYLLLLLGCILAYLVRVGVKRVSKKNIFIGFLIILVAYVLLNSGVVQQKFNSDSISFTIRLNDQLNGIKAAFVSPITGLGYNTEQYLNVLDEFGITENSSGILCAFQQFGIFIGGALLYFMCKGIWKIVGSEGIAQFVFLAIMVLLFSTEVFVTRASFVIFLFQFKNISSTDCRRIRLKFK